ncbi:MAG: protein translocase subunit SecDF [Bacteroidales bacterium]|nr:protein translocase subunit SecDF [Bacteroidales bacterium]
MQNKGLIRFLAWAFVLVCLYQLSYTFVTSSVNRKAKKAAEAYAASETTQTKAALLANGDELAKQVKLDSLQTAYEAHYLDSMANEKVYLGSTYRQCQGKEINLGLDLKGGMNVMLEVSTADVVRSLAHKDLPDNGLFEKAMEAALARQKVTTNKDFVSLFCDEIERINREMNGEKELRLASYFIGPKLPNIKATDNNAKVKSELQSATKSAYEMTYERLCQRIDKFGVAQPSIQKLEASERILVELPGVKEPERVRKLLQSTAQLEFWRTHDNMDEYGFKTLDKINSSLAVMGAGTEEVDTTAAEEVAEAEEESEDTSLVDQLAVNGNEKVADQGQPDQMKDNPLFAKLYPNVTPNGQLVAGPVVGMARRSDRDAINEMLALAAEKKWYDTRRVKYLWSAKPLKDNQDIYQLYAIAVENDGNPVLGGEVITDARQDFSQVGGNEISMTMNTEGARDWKQITGANVGKCIAIVMDNVVYSAPVVNGEIAGGRSSITGDFTLDEAKDLANILKSGKLEAPAIIVQEAVVGPSLGQESITRGLISFILAFIVVLIYMVVFYNRAGWVSVIALITNVFLLIGILASIGSVLTLPGIAGIVLTMAMAVDGNVIIYERIKEELRNGSSVANSVDTGFKNAYSAIIDGQVTTFLLGLVLIMFGSGPVRGFAVTLCIGIVTSLFTSIFITRLVIDNLLRAHKKINFSFPFSADFMRNVHINFIGKRKVFYIIMACAILICAVGFATRGLSFGIDFSGGRTYVVRFDQPVNAVEVRSSMNKQFDEAPEVKTYGPSTQLKITTKYKIKEDGDEVKNEIMAKLYEGAKGYYAKPITLDEFKSTETNPLGIIQAEQVGGTIAHDNLVHSIWAIIGGLLIIFVYIGLRFRSWRFGLGSVAALTHDTILVIGMFSLLYGLLPFNLEVDQYFISAVLTVIGYSINATVVIFDRVREYKKLYPKRDLMTHMNDAINSTLARTINTSGTTFVTLLMMFIFGGEVIRGFIFALLVGVVCGMFSSVCIACPVVYEISKRRENKTKAVEAK